MRFGNVSSLLLLAFGSMLTVGCATKSPDIEVAAADYPDTFNAARDVLHSYRFTLERIDARAGVLTTKPKLSGGFLTPWSQLESTPSQEWEDTVHNQQRRVEIVFAPVPAPDATEPDLKPNQAREHASDLIEAPRNTTAHVRVVLERIYQYGWRPNTRSTYLASITQNTQADAPSRVEVEIADDEALAGRIAAEIRSRMNQRAQAQPAESQPEPAAP